jgi:hypothetical protein
MNLMMILALFVMEKGLPLFMGKKVRHVMYVDQLEKYNRTVI